MHLVHSHYSIVWWHLGRYGGIFNHIGGYGGNQFDKYRAPPQLPFTSPTDSPSATRIPKHKGVP